MSALRLRIAGRVQGVGFRAFVARKARARGLSGYVRNLADGAVEAVLCGPAADVAAVAEDCRQGPPLSRVTSCASDEVAEEGWSGFSVRTGD